MKKIFVLLLILFCGNVYSEQFNMYNVELIKTYTLGEDENQFKLDMDADYPIAPTGVVFDETGTMFVADPIKKRFVETNNRFDYVREYYNMYACSGRYLFIIDNRVYWQGRLYFACDENYKQKFLIDLHSAKSPLINYRQVDFYYFENLVIISYPGEILCSILNPGLDYKENSKNVLNYDKTMKLIKELKVYKSGLLTITDNIIYINGEFETQIYNEYYTYWLKRNDGDMVIKTKITPDPERYYKASTLTAYIGKDGNANIYWENNDTIIIFNKYGQAFENFYPIEYDLISSFPALHPSGDLYWLGWDLKGVYLYRIKNVWDPEGREAWFKAHDEAKTTLSSSDGKIEMSSVLANFKIVKSLLGELKVIDAFLEIVNFLYFNSKI